MAIIHDQPLSRRLPNSLPNGNGTFPENSKFPGHVNAPHAVKNRYRFHRFWSQQTLPVKGQRGSISGSQAVPSPLQLLMNACVSAPIKLSLWVLPCEFHVS